MQHVLPMMFLQDSSSSSGGSAAGGAIAAVFGLIYLVVIVVMVAAMWKVFVKAGKPGWAAIVPIYNIIVLLEIVGKPLWWFVLLLIPFVNLIMLFIISIALAQKFGKGAGFGVGLTILSPIFYPMLAWGDATYHP